MPGQTVSTWTEHSDVVVYVIGGLFVIIGSLFSVVSWFVIRTIRQIDDNQSKISQSQERMADIIFDKIERHGEKLSELEKDFSMLKGEHHARICGCVPNNTR